MGKDRSAWFRVSKLGFLFICIYSSLTAMFALDAQIAYEEAMATLFLPESGSILAKTIQVWQLYTLPIFSQFS
jgi:hypothetical protein